MTINNAPAALTDGEVQALMQIMHGLKLDEQLVMMRLLMRLKQVHEMCEEYRVAWLTVAGALDVKRRVN